MTMTRALDKIAEPDGGWLRRFIICHRCGHETAVLRGTLLSATACVVCVQRLETSFGADGVAATAVRAMSDWCDKATVPGPGYGIVECPHCTARCVVEVGAAARTGCATCLRPLGAQPLLRMDFAALATPVVLDPRDEDDDRSRFSFADYDDDTMPLRA